jgi:hypothetical protein
MAPAARIGLRTPATARGMPRCVVGEDLELGLADDTTGAASEGAPCVVLFLPFFVRSNQHFDVRPEDLVLMSSIANVLPRLLVIRLRRGNCQQCGLAATFPACWGWRVIRPDGGCHFGEGNASENFHDLLLCLDPDGVRGTRGVALARMF